ncbi:MAG: SUMF1/EgtB/PvdO family nonheme iron enzyme [Planctomycetota bacterium]|nr:SUMF1/EgtB/PvdO family nonheme iron enzyme [Planctomycetota bacterium]
MVLSSIIVAQRGQALGNGLLASIFAGLVAGCAPSGSGTSSVVEWRIAELEALAFVPEGLTRKALTPIDAGASEDLLVDRFEVTWAMWDRAPGDAASAAVAPFRPDADAPEALTSPLEWLEDAPAVGMTLSEARAFAASRSMRIPTFDEWMYCALGQRGRRAPAGSPQRGSANTSELGVARATPVGAFESGRTPDHGIYDLLGNVWEWIDAPPDPSRGWSTIDVETRPEEAVSRAEAWCLGGSFLTPERPIYTVGRVCLALEVSAGHRASDLGLRCVTGAEIYLRGLPSEEALSSDERERIARVGQRWGSPAVRLLGRLQREGVAGAWIEALLAGASR